MALSKDVRDMTADIKNLMTCMRSRAHEIKKTIAHNNHILSEEITKLQQVSDSLSTLDDPMIAEEIAREKQVLLALDEFIEHTTKEICQLKMEVKEREDELGATQEQLQIMNTTQPRARYAVNLFRQISLINWHTGQLPNEVRGFIRGKSVKTFCFDEQKQSRFFITNSLWQMGEEEIW